MTALAHGMGIDGGWRSSTRSRYPRFGNSRSKYCPMKPVAPVSARSIQASSVGSKLIICAAATLARFGRWLGARSDVIYTIMSDEQRRQRSKGPRPSRK
jgi:hypothetical protein